MFVLLAALLCCCVAPIESKATTPENVKQDVVKYLIEYGYLESLTYTNNELKKSLRQLQREHVFIVNGKITPEVINLVKRENDKQMVIEYLKTFGYIQQNNINPIRLTDAIKVLQRNSGKLAITGTIDADTINFIKNHPHGYSEGLFA